MTDEIQPPVRDETLLEKIEDVVIGHADTSPATDKLCDACAEKLTPAGIQWQDLCPKCYKKFVS